MRDNLDEFRRAHVLLGNGCRERSKPLIDNHHRVINYLRLSVTDRCNLRCVYCMPEQGIPFVAHSEILTYEEMLRIVQLCIQQGIRKVRLTGGEPLVRKGFIGFVERLCKIEGLDEITVTTNGVLLKDCYLSGHARNLLEKEQRGTDRKK